MADIPVAPPDLQGLAGTLDVPATNVQALTPVAITLPDLQSVAWGTESAPTTLRSDMFGPYHGVLNWWTGAVWRGVAPSVHAASHGTGQADAVTIAPAQVTGTAVVTGDARLSDARTPTAHTHTSIDATADSSIAADKKFLLEGAGSDSYIIYNSTTKKIELYADGVLVSSWGYNGLKLLMDGTTSVLDLISGAAFTMTGGVGNTWPGDSSNFRTLLGAQAPVIAQATDNLLPDNVASFEDGGTTGISAGDKFNFANDATQAYHGSKSLKLTATGNGFAYVGINVPATAAAQYTHSLRFKGTVGRSYFLRASDNSPGSNDSATVVADGTWQTLTVTRTFAGTAFKDYFLCADTVTNDTAYLDCQQFEAGAGATPFALDSRTACTMTIPTATIGLTAGQPLSMMFVVNTPWAGNDGIEHTLFSATGAGAGDVYRLYKGTDNKLYFAVGDKSAVTAALTTTTWAANVNHVIIGTVTGGTINVYLAGAAGTPATGTTREAALNANAYIGTKTDGTLPANAAVLGAAYGRVLTSGEITALTSIATWGTAALGSLPAIGSTRFDDSTDRLYVYTSNGWKYATLT